MRVIGIAGRLVLVALAIVFCLSTDVLPTIGDASSPPNTHVSDYYIEGSVRDSGSNNMVTAVLADYRGFDTLFETTVMFSAGIITVLLLPRSRRENKKEKALRESKSESEKEGK